MFYAYSGLFLNEKNQNEIGKFNSETSVKIPKVTNWQSA